jgi:hypothetical protein
MGHDHAKARRIDGPQRSATERSDGIRGATRRAIRAVGFLWADIDDPRAATSRHHGQQRWHACRECDG